MSSNVTPHFKILSQSVDHSLCDTIFKSAYEFRGLGFWTQNCVVCELLFSLSFDVLKHWNVGFIYILWLTLLNQFEWFNSFIHLSIRTGLAKRQQNIKEVYLKAWCFNEVKKALSRRNPIKAFLSSTAVCQRL